LFKEPENILNAWTMDSVLAQAKAIFDTIIHVFIISNYNMNFRYI